MKLIKMFMHSLAVPTKVLVLALQVSALSLLVVDTAHAQKGKPRSLRPNIQKAHIDITKFGYEPGSIAFKRGIPARVTFLRKADQTCATEVVFADYGISRELPLNQLITVNFTPRKAGEFAFTCGMNMHRGKLIVR